MRVAIKSLKVLVMLGSAFSPLPPMTFAQHYIQKNLVSDGFVQTQNPPDSNLKNAWGLARSTTSPWWVANNGSGTSTLYNGNTGAKVSLVVTVPPPAKGSSPATPTGVVFNGSPSDFLLAPGKPALFIFVTEDGTISGWNPGVNLTNAILKVDNSNEAVYKGVTIAEMNGKRFLYVANFHSGRIEVYDTNFGRVQLHGEAFNGDGVPDDFAPFNVQSVGENLYVTYAKQDAAKHDDVAGEGFGYVDVFSPSGRRLTRLEHGSWFNAPWGIALAPRDFGEFSHELLVGNFGSGQIAAFNPVTGDFIGLMKNPDDTVLKIDGLWALGFGNSGSAGPYNTLFFTAGPNDEQDGLFGTLVPIPAELAEADEP